MIARFGNRQMTESGSDAFWMRLAIREAKKGQGRTSPNPCVGAVVVKDGRLVAKGWHRRAGTPHAEVHALRAAGGKARGATLFVTLEPCNHTGRTPPCTRAILAAGIRRVVVGMSDPNPRVAGGGAGMLAEHGLTVASGVMAAECEALNRPFIKQITTGLPWVILKAGMSLDGRLATSPGQCTRITGDESRREVHRLRERVDAILIGSGTARCDDPALTVRLSGRRGRDPLRVLLDTGLNLPATARMLTQASEADTWIFCGPRADKGKAANLAAAGAIIKPVPFGPDGCLDLVAVLQELGQAGVNSLLIEGGGQVHGSFLRAGMVDEVKLFVAPLFLGGEGVALLDKLELAGIDGAPVLAEMRTRRLGRDLLIEGLVMK